jgi:cytosine permease
LAVAQTEIVADKISPNDYATERVPLSERRSTLDVAMVAAGFCICMSGLFTGAAMAAGLNMREALIAALCGNAILSLYGGAIGAAGAREGLSSSRIAIFSFGRQGFKIACLILALTMGGWFAVQCGFFGNTIHAMFPNAGFITDPNIAGFWGGILMLLSAYFGYKGLSVLSKIAVPLIAIIATVGTITAINYSGGWAKVLALVPQGDITVSEGVVMAVGSFAAGAAAQADITRYAKDAKAGWLASAFGYLIANTFIIIAGYLSTLVTGIGDLPKAMLQLGLGIPALIVLIAAQWTTNDNNLYTSSLGLSNIFKIKKSRITLTLGIIGSILGGVGVANYFTGWLNILGTGVPPMAGVIVADYYILNRKSYQSIDENRLPMWNVNAVISLVVGCVVGFTVKAGISSINSLLTAMIVYLVLMKINPYNLKHQEREDI